MKRKYHKPEQIIRKLREAERLQQEERKSLGEICQILEISEQTYHRWRKKYGGMREGQAKELKSLREENDRLKKMVADLSLDRQMLQEALKAERLAERLGTCTFLGVVRSD